MTDMNRPQPFGTEERFTTPHYVSFVLRCWTGGTGQVHARLFVAHSGVSHLVTNLDSLPELVRQLVTNDLLPTSFEDADQTNFQSKS